MSRPGFAPRVLWVGLMMLILGSAGCATTPKRDWAQMVGRYTYDEAVKEYGPPDKKETTTDGTVVTEWTLRRGSVYSTPGPGWGMGGGWRRPWGWGAAMDVHSTPDSILRLQFEPDGRLKNWKEYFK